MARSRRTSFFVRVFVLVAVVICGSSIGLPFDDRQRMSLQTLEVAPATAGETTVMRSPGDEPVVLKVDDGSVEQALGVVNNEQTIGSQAIYLNRFTIPSELLPFSMDTVSILFPTSTQAGTTGLVAGLPFDMLVYVDPTGSGDPAQAELKVQRSFLLQPSNTVFQDIPTGAPVTIQSGDVWVGFTNTVTASDNRAIFPGAVDSSASQGRSYVFFNDMAGEHFFGPLDTAEVAVIIQANWLIRASGQQGGSTCVRWDAPPAARGDTLPPPVNTRLCDTVPPVAREGEEPASPGAVTGYNVYRSNTPGVQTTAANRFASVPPTQTSVGSSVAPGGSFFVVTAMYGDQESGPSDEFAIVPPSVTSLKVKPMKINAKGVNFTATVQVFMDGIPFTSPAVVKANGTKVIQKGTLLTGQTIGAYLAANGNRARIDFRNSNGALQSLDVQP